MRNAWWGYPLNAALDRLRRNGFPAQAERFSSIGEGSINRHQCFRHPRFLRLDDMHIRAYYGRVKIEFNPAKATANLKKHGIPFEVAQSCLLDPMALAREDPDARGEPRWVLVGMSQGAGLLTVCYTLRGEDVIRLISARRATVKEKKDSAQGI